MKRAIIVPAAPAPDALADLKSWLAITTAREDAALTGLLAAALELCEGFTGSLPLESTCEERVAATGAWQRLATRPVQSVILVEAVSADGTRSPLPADRYGMELDGDGTASVRLLVGGDVRQLVVRFVAGLAATWSDLPAGLRHGVVRCAAHLHRQDGAGAAVPSAVAALWRPWRRLRLA
jgi:uncharacterized phiE125 gp8 family phage protein